MGRARQPGGSRAVNEASGGSCLDRIGERLLAFLSWGLPELSGKARGGAGNTSKGWSRKKHPVLGSLWPPTAPNSSHGRVKWFNLPERFSRGSHCLPYVLEQGPVYSQPGQCQPHRGWRSWPLSPKVHSSQRRLVTQLDRCMAPGRSKPRVVLGNAAAPCAGVRGPGCLGVPQQNKTSWGQGPGRECGQRASPGRKIIN